MDIRNCLLLLTMVSALGMGCATSTAQGRPDSYRPSSVTTLGGKSGIPTVLSRDQVIKGMSQVAGAVKYCGQSNGVAVTVKVVIDESGKVISTKVVGPFAGTPVAACAENVVLLAKFPKSQKKVTVKYPFLLKRAHSS